VACNRNLVSLVFGNIFLINRLSGIVKGIKKGLVTASNLRSIGVYFGNTEN
jgi:hypothetical protein